MEFTSMPFTYLDYFRAKKLLAIGPYSCSLEILKDDLRAIWNIYEKEAKDLTLPEFYHIWTDAEASLLHYACPPNYGRIEFMNVLYALFFGLWKF
ncbi:hypothetical protein HMI54_015287 [Coelomomyces lativittatus]|nr:hypothetical protein HMI55_005805 [Coelomomyces lativittatus]KAJ1504583.1 hypothetical protein HMI56_001560 [Coelomomyces lativittatus]KAJ1513020.1 hypothetical protein HMI54_015287 [Coelomomyces lativittatus]